MTNQECLERAMFAASHSYSHAALELEDCFRDESDEQEENTTLKSKGSVVVLRAA